MAGFKTNHRCPKCNGQVNKKGIVCFACQDDKDIEKKTNRSWIRAHKAMSKYIQESKKSLDKEVKHWNKNDGIDAALANFPDMQDRILNETRKGDDNGGK